MTCKARPLIRYAGSLATALLECLAHRDETSQVLQLEDAVPVHQATLQVPMTMQLQPAAVRHNSPRQHLLPDFTVQCSHYSHSVAAKRPREHNRPPLLPADV